MLPVIANFAGYVTNDVYVCNNMAKILNTIPLVWKTGLDNHRMKLYHTVNWKVAEWHSYTIQSHPQTIQLTFSQLSEPCKPITSNASIISMMMIMYIFAYISLQTTIIFEGYILITDSRYCCPPLHIQYL